MKLEHLIKKIKLNKLLLEVGRMQLSQLKLIKSVTKWRYSVSLRQSPSGVYVVEHCNYFTGKTHKTNIVDYGLASAAFERFVDDYEGN
jgi:hypothetical protein